MKEKEQKEMHDFMKKHYVFVMVAVCVALTLALALFSGCQPVQQPNETTSEPMNAMESTETTTIPVETTQATTVPEETLTPSVPETTVEETVTQETTAPETTDSEVSVPETTEDTQETKPNTQGAQQSHKHKYTGKKTEPTCEKEGYTTYTCSCGDSYKGDKVKALGHSYSDKVVAPTATEKGYTEHTCSRCGDSYKDSYTNPIPAETTKPTQPPVEEPSEPPVTEPPETTVPPTNPPETEPPATTVPPTEPAPTEHKHDYTAIVTNPTCYEGGYTTYTCACGDSYLGDNTEAAGHTWRHIYHEATGVQVYYSHVCNCGAPFNSIEGIKAHRQEIIDTKGAEEMLLHHSGWAPTTIWEGGEGPWDEWECRTCGEKTTKNPFH